MGTNGDVMKRSNFLVLFHVASAGQNGPLLGSDEEDIIYIIYVLFDVTKKQVGTLRNLWKKANDNSQ